MQMDKTDQWASPCLCLIDNCLSTETERSPLYNPPPPLEVLSLSYSNWIVSQNTLRTYATDIFVERHILTICPFLSELQRERRHANGGSQPFSTHLYKFKNYYFNYSKDMLRMVGYHFSSLDKNRQIYGHG